MEFEDDFVDTSIFDIIEGLGTVVLRLGLGTSFCQRYTVTLYAECTDIIIPHDDEICRFYEQKLARN